MTDYHVKVLLQARVPAATRARARQEAERRGLTFSDYITSLIDAGQQQTAGEEDSTDA